MLHITNGESVTGTFRQVRFPGTYLAWNDVLHDGPVPATSTLSELSDIRAHALAQFGGGSYEQIRSGFATRDDTLEDFREHQDVVLWFEHDLFDQLQLIQLLDWFSTHEEGKTRLSLIQINSHPGVKPFYGLGQLSGTQLARLFPQRQTVTAKQLITAHEAWQVFRAVATGSSAQQEIYKESQKLDDYPWGDASVYLHMNGLASGPSPALVETKKNEYAITDHGRQLLEGKADWTTLSAPIDIWLGGVHLTGKEHVWRWDEEKQLLMQR